MGLILVSLQSPYPLSNFPNMLSIQVNFDISNSFLKNGQNITNNNVIFVRGITLALNK